MKVRIVYKCCIKFVRIVVVPWAPLAQAMLYIFLVSVPVRRESPA